MADNRIIAAEDGEYVVNNRAVRQPGVRKLLDLLNFGLFPKSPDKKSIMGDYLQQSYGHGGPVEEHQPISYGGYDVAYPEVGSLYDEFGFEPKEEYLGRFKEYDIGRETPYREEYGTKVGALQRGARSGLGTATEKAMSLGRGFAGFGEREYGMGQTRKSMLGKYLTGKEQAYGTMFKGIRGEREGYLTDMAAQMRHIESIGGTQEHLQTCEEQGLLECDSGECVESLLNCEG